MRIYDLHVGLDEFVKQDVQIEIIGEHNGWTYDVRRSEWDNDLQRFVYYELGGGTCPTFLGAYDGVAELIDINTEES